MGDEGYKCQLSDILEKLTIRQGQDKIRDEFDDEDDKDKGKNKKKK